MAGIATYWHTVKYLRPVQIYGRMLYLLPRRTRVAGSAPAIEPAKAPWAQPVPARASLVAPGRFCFLNEERYLGWPVDWRAPDAPLLWRYNLHYFDGLNAAGGPAAPDWHGELIESWIDRNAPGTAPGWDAYPTSLRIVNWIKWSLAGGDLSTPARDSLAQQVRWLSSRLEWHLLGNHLFANAKALAIAGCFFAGNEAEYWRKAGTAILERELEEQVLPDGGNFELSPMYHSIFLADVLDLLNIGRRYPGKMASLEPALRDKASTMLDWLRVMTHPDGEIALFNDSAFGIAPTLADLLLYARRLGIEPTPAQRPAPGNAPTLTALEQSGYARLEAGPAVALCDVAPVGPDHLPGHAHADTLSFELSVAGERIVVNGGTSRYGSDRARLRERGTGSHSTVIVNCCDSSEVWNGFRVARRARPSVELAARGLGGVRLQAAHDGYRRLDPRIVHRRVWNLRRDSLVVGDEVTGPWEAATAQFLLHHEVGIASVEPDWWRLSHPRLPGAVLEFKVLAGKARIVEAAHSLEFGRRMPTRAIAVDLAGTHSEVEISWPGS